MREITEKDINGYTGYATKTSNDCPFIQRKYTEHDIFGHDDYDSFCTKDGTDNLKKIAECISCVKCPMATNA